jgi:hypothetical protein
MCDRHPLCLCCKVHSVLFYDFLMKIFNFLEQTVVCAPANNPSIFLPFVDQVPYHFVCVHNGYSVCNTFTDTTGLLALMRVFVCRSGCLR